MPVSKTRTPAKPRPKPVQTPTEPLGPGSDEDFTYEFPNGETVTVPSLAVARKPNFDEFTSAQTILDVNVRGAVTTRMFLMSACGDAWDTVKSFDMDEVQAFVEAWGDHSGANLGE